MDSNEVIKHLKEVYNKISPFFTNTRQRLHRSVVPLVKYAKDGDKILDLGCGNGILYHLFDKLQVGYVGADLSNELLDIARKNYPGVTFVETNMAEKFPFEDDMFDEIYCIAAFHHLPDEQTRLKALREMRRVLKTDGRVIMTNWNLSSEWAANKVEKGKYTKTGEQDFIVPWRDPQGNVLGERYYRAFKSQELQNLFEQAGFIVEEQYFTENEQWTDGRQGGNIVSVVRK